eukprot:6150313-Lingulodinium_polyedra.AAC.1
MACRELRSPCPCLPPSGRPCLGHPRLARLPSGSGVWSGVRFAGGRGRNGCAGAAGPGGTCLTGRIRQYSTWRRRE